MYPNRRNSPLPRAPAPRPRSARSRTAGLPLLLLALGSISACAAETRTAQAPADSRPALQRSDSAPRQEGAPAAKALAKDEAEQRILTVLTEMGADRSRRHLSVAEEDGRVLRVLTEAAGAQRVVEVGTSTGYSGLWFALALRRSGGKLVTHELDPERAKEARANFEKAGVGESVTVVVATRTRR